MKQPVKADVRLKCKIQWSGSVELEIYGFTRELARDYVVVDAGVLTHPDRFWPGRNATLAIELPPFRLQAPRVLECDVTVAGFRVAKGHAHVELAIRSMSLALRRYPLSRGRLAANASNKFKPQEKTKMITFQNMFHEEDGQDMVEYGLVVALIAIIVMAGITVFGTNLNTGFGSINGKIATNVK